MTCMAGSEPSWPRHLYFSLRMNDEIKNQKHHLFWQIKTKLWCNKNKTVMKATWPWPGSSDYDIDCGESSDALQLALTFKVGTGSESIDPNSKLRCKAS